jgi:predicted methyltransferase
LRKGLPNFLAVTVYEENILEYNDYQREAIMSYLIMVRDVIRSYNVPCELHGETHMPRRGKV